MPNLIKTIPETMRKKGIPEETITLLSIPEASDFEAVMELVKRMDGLLSNEQCLIIMQEQGCCKTGKPAAAHREFGQKYMNKTLKEKVELLNSSTVQHKAPCHLNSDGTLSVYWGKSDLRKRSCPCGFIRKLPDTYEVPKTFCGCCGGHIRSNYQRSLGVKLNLKEIVSSSSSSKGEKRCEFLFDVIE